MSNNFTTINDQPGSIVHDNALTIDLRTRPTRADLGIADGSNSRSYQRPSGVASLATTVLLPTGALRVPATSVTASSDDGGGADDTVTTHLPKDFGVFRSVPSDTALAPILSADAGVLGLSAATIQRGLATFGGGAVLARSVLTGFVHDWLSVEVELTAEDGGVTQIYYHFQIDTFHNPALDAVVHDGVLSLDLGASTRPSRRELAFLDTYASATVVPAPGSSLTVRVGTPSGQADCALGQLSSSADSPTGAPTRSTLSLHAAGLSNLESELVRQAPAFGIDAAAVRAVFAGADGHVTRTLTGSALPHVRISLKIDAVIGQPGAFAAKAAYTLTYR